ncbi:MAG: tetratricopeptide repeat protein [Vicinamibacterales bacterium]
MSPKRYSVAVVTGLVLALALSSSPSMQEFGSITFPTSGAAAAQEAFLTGVKALHNFQFDEAAVAFQQAQQADPSFAMAYWGEAMSHNHPLWAQQDVEKAKQALDRLDPTPAGRVAKAQLPKEKAFFEAIHTLYFSPGDKLARDQAYSQAMARMYAQWPDDHEIATFYALSLLGTVRPGDTGFRRQAMAASIVQKVYQQNPKHPGAVHFIIHSFDDPDHAPLALDAADAYAKIAPSAAHALHMPSHIYVQLGMWQKAALSNIDAYKAAVDLNTRMKLPEGREDFHTLSWLAYANTMLGQYDEAKKNVAQAKAAADRNPGNAGIRDGYLGMRARYISDTGQWEKLTLAAPAAPTGGEHANMPGMAGMPGMGSGGSATWTYIVGVSAAKTGDMATAEAAETALKGITAKAQGGPTAYAARPHLVREKELGAIIRWAKGQKEEALAFAKEAADAEKTLNAPSGPPDPIKPAFELYGEMLLDAGRANEAMQAFEQSLLRTPKRTPSVLGLARAATAAGDPATARARYQELATMPGAAATSQAVQEAQKALKATNF